MANGGTDIRAISEAILRDGLSWIAGENELTALPRSEQMKRLGLIVTPEEQQRLEAERIRVASLEQSVGVGLVGAPTSVDWRNHGGNFVTPIKNQGQCGSCVGHCTCAVIEAAVRIKLNQPTYNIDLSEGFLQFCGGGSCNGWGLTSGLDYAKSTGVTDEACMPYTAGGGTNMNCATKCSDWQNRLTKISSYTSYATMDARKNAIATIGPVLAGMEVWSDFFAYNGGSVYVKSSAATRLNPPGYHCLSVVGYDDVQQCWIVKNSWGTTWGDAGFGRIGYGQTDLLIDSSWMFYSVVVQILAAWHNNVTVSQVYATRDSQNAWAYFAGLGWRRIQTGAADGVTNMLALFAQAVAKNKLVTIYCDGDLVYQAYLL